MANEYADNIRRIARGDRRRGGLSRQGERDAIEGGSVPLLTNAEIAELNNEQPTPPSTAPESEDKDPEDNEQQENIDPNNPNSGYRGAQSSTGSQTDEGTYDVGDVIDGTGNAPGSATGSDGSQNSGALRELTGLKDCESETPFNLHMDGNYIPPEGWESPETPPTDETWFQGVYFANSTNEIRFNTAQEAATYFENQAINDPSRPFIAFTTEWQPALTTDPPAQQYTRDYDRDPGSSSINFFSFDCIENDVEGDEGVYCTSEPPTAEAWPEDGTYDLAIKDGQLQTSEFDADKPRDEALGTKPFCFGDGRTGEARVTADGGLMVYETGAEGAPIGAATVYDSSGDFRAAGDATETFINQYLPK